jgi:hypothetical protein
MDTTVDYSPRVREMSVYFKRPLFPAPEARQLRNVDYRWRVLEYR